jgi:hypothetical protein
MSRSGPPPKDASVRARRNKDTVQMRVLDARQAGRPDLPVFQVRHSWKDTESGAILSEMVDFDWPELTRQWWETLDFHPLAHEFIDADWAFLLETARIHAEFWLGDVKLGGELRQRESKYGFTPEDRIKMRLSVAVATEAEVRAEQKIRKRDADARTAVAPTGDDPRLVLVQ